LVELWLFEGLLFWVEDFLFCIGFLLLRADSHRSGVAGRLRAIPQGLDGLNT